MNALELENLMASAASEVLEEAAFIFSSPREAVSDRSTWPGEFVVADLPVYIPKRSWIRMATTFEVGVHIAAEILGEKREGFNGVFEPVRDALGEVLNMVCGLFAELLLGPEGAWELGCPRTRTITPAEYFLERGWAAAVVLLEDENLGPIELMIFDMAAKEED